MIYDQVNKHNYESWKEDMCELTKNERKIKAAIHYFFEALVGMACKVAELIGKKF